jgi:hypothetical protein
MRDIQMIKQYRRNGESVTYHGRVHRLRRAGTPASARGSRRRKQPGRG